MINLTTPRFKAWEYSFHTTMLAQFQKTMLFASRAVFPDGSGQPTICSHKETSRLLHYRLEVIEAALLTLAELQSRAATTPEVKGTQL